MPLKPQLFSLVTLLSVLAMRPAVDAQAWWDGQWSMRIPITITEVAGIDITDYALRLDVPVQPEMNLDYSDLRFVSAATLAELDYWIDIDLSTPAAVTVWVELDAVGASSAALVHMYYGNQAAPTASDIKAAFLVGDDFADETIDWSIWTSSGMAPAQFGGQLHLTTTDPVDGVTPSHFRSIWQADFNAANSWEFRFHGMKHLPPDVGSADYATAGFQLDADDNTPGEVWLKDMNHFPHGADRWWADDGRAQNNGCTWASMVLESDPSICVQSYPTGITIDSAFLERRYVIGNDHSRITLRDPVTMASVTAVGGNLLPTPPGSQRPVGWGSSCCNPAEAQWTIDFAWARKVVSPEPTAMLGIPQVPSPWTDLDHGLAGSSGIPLLVCMGSLMAGTSGSITISNIPSGALGALVVGFSTFYAPFKGGVMVPNPDLVIPTGSGIGTIILPFVWPHGVPSGFAFYLQYWVVDVGGPQGYAASNACCGVTP